MPKTTLAEHYKKEMENFLSNLNPDKLRAVAAIKENTCKNQGDLHWYHQAIKEVATKAEAAFDKIKAKKENKSK